MRQLKSSSIRPKQSLFLPFLFTFLGIGILIISGYLIYNNFRMKQQPAAIPPATFINQAPEPTKRNNDEWITYTDSQYPFQIEHPISWIIQETNLYGEIRLVTLSNTKGDGTIQIFYEGEGEHGFDPWVKVLDKKVLIGNKSAKLVVMQKSKKESPEGGWAIYTIPELGKFRIETQYTGEINQILSTFKLTSTPESKSSTSYISPGNEFQIIIPPGFVVQQIGEQSMVLNNNLPPDSICKGGGCFLGTQRLNMYFDMFNTSQDLATFAKERRDVVMGIDPNASSLQAKKLGNTPSYEFASVGEGFCQTKIIKISNSSGLSISTCYPSKDDVTTYQGQANQILSTLKFSDK